MSKLFNTLEQIRRNESYQVSGGATRPLSRDNVGAHRNKTLFILAFIAAFSAAIYLGIPLLMKKSKIPSTPQNPETILAAATSHTAEPASTDSLLRKQDPPQINNRAADLIKNGEPWRGIYLLESLTREKPEMIEAYINLGVALSELGLFEPAKRYFKKAIQLDPTNQALQDNLQILINSGIIDRSFSLDPDEEAKGSGPFPEEHVIGEVPLNRSMN